MQVLGGTDGYRPVGYGKSMVCTSYVLRLRKQGKSKSGEATRVDGHGRQDLSRSCSH